MHFSCTTHSSANWIDEEWLNNELALKYAINNGDGEMHKSAMIIIAMVV